MLQQLKPFTIMSRKGIRLRDIWTQQAFQRVLNIPDKMIVDKAQYLAQKYHAQLFENDSFEYFMSVAKSRFWEVANYFDDLMDRETSKNLFHLITTVLGLRFGIFMDDLRHSHLSVAGKKTQRKRI